MIRRELLNAWYGDSSIQGDVVALYRDKEIQLNNRSIVLPNENVLQLVLYRSGNKIYLAGQGNETGTAWFYSDGVWKGLGPCFGVNSCLIAEGRLFIVRSGDTVDIYDIDDTSEPLDTRHQQIGVNGIRYVESGIITTGDETYNGSVDPEINIAEYTVLSDVKIGQGYNGGCIAVFSFNGKKYRSIIEPGDCKFIRCHRDLNNFSIYIVKQVESKGVFLSFQFNELLDLNQETQNIPIPGPTPMTVPNKSVELEQFHRDYGVVNNDDDSKRKFVLAFASYLNGIDKSGRWGGKAREGFDEPSKATLGYWIGDNPPTFPTDGKMHVFQLVGSNGVVSWDTRAENNDPDYNNISGRFFPSNSVTPNPNPNPVPNPMPNPTDLEQRVLALEAKFANLDRSLIQDGQSIGLETWNGKFLCAEDGGNLRRDQNPLATDRTAVGPWETLKIRKQ